MNKKKALTLFAMMISVGGMAACAQSSSPKESSMETTMEDHAMTEADKAAQAAEEAAKTANGEARRASAHSAEADAEKVYPPPAKIEPMPWPAMQRRIAALIASINQPEDTHPKRVEGVLGVRLAQTSITHWKAEGVFSERWEYSISVADSGDEEGAAGYDIYIYLTPPKEYADKVAASPETKCTWSMDEFSKILLQNGYVKGAERKLANEVWDFVDLTSDATYNRYVDGFVYRMKDGSESGVPCLSRVHISSGYKEDRQ